jgi:hypothetical protein
MLRTAALALIAALGCVRPATADPKVAADAFRATCIATAHDIAKVDAIARENKWQAQDPHILVVPFEKRGKGMRRVSAWRGERDRVRFSVATGDEANAFDTTTICMMRFDDAVDLTAFLREIAGKPDAVSMQQTPQGYFGVLEIEDNRTGRLSMLFAADGDGRLIAWALANREIARR